MSRCFVWLLSVVLLASAVEAQCFSVAGTSVVASLMATSTFAIDDESQTPDLPFQGWTFPMGATNWSHFVVNSNGEVYLTDGQGVVEPALFGVSELAEMRSVVGGSPRIMALGGDLQGVAGLVGWDIRVDDSIANEVTVSWAGMRAYQDNTSNWSCSVRLTSVGEVVLSYAAGTFGALDNGNFAGVSIGNGVGTAVAPGADLNATGDSGTLGLVYQNDWTPFDLDDQSILFAPNGNGGFASQVVCGGPPNPPATVTSVGVGCYDATTFASVYHLFANSAAANAVLQTSSFNYAPTAAGGMVLSQGGSGFRPSFNPTRLNHGNDSFAQVTPSVPFLHLGTTPIADFYVSSNGFVMLGGADPNALAATTIAGFAAAGAPTFVAYGTDLNPAVAGAYSFEEDAGVLYITAVNVSHASAAGSQTFQFQFELATGVVTVAYDSVAALDPDAVLVGYTPGGGVLDMGGIDLTSDLPYEASMDTSTIAMSMSAGPAPISLPGSGTTMRFDLIDVPDVAPGVVGALGVLVISLGSSPGMDLGFLGASGCNLYVATLDATIAFVNPGATTATVAFAIPAGVPPTSMIFAQGAALSSGVNDASIVTSNSLELFVSDN